MSSLRARPALVTAAAAVAVAGALWLGGPGFAASSRPGVARAAGAAGPRRLAPARPRPPRHDAFSDWTMFRGDPAHSGLSRETAISTSTAPSLASQWTASLGTTSDTSPAVATSSALGEALVYAGASNHLSAYPAGGGQPVWTYKVGTGVVDTSPAVFGGAVYFGTTTGAIYAVNASTGALRCSFRTGNAVLASPVVVNDPDGSGPVVYDATVPGSGPGAEWAIYGAGSTHGSCARAWEFTAFAVAPGGSWSSPAYATDADDVPLLVFGSKDSVYALDADTGALAWRYRTSSAKEADVGASPTISPPGKNGFADGVVYVTGKDKIVYALNLTTGKQIWKYQLAHGSHGDLSGTALVGDQIYLGSDTGVYALNATTGALAWNVLSQSVFYASPVVTGPSRQQVLVIGSNEGGLYALDLATGATLWSQQLSKRGIWASAAVSQGSIYVAGLDGVLHSYAPTL
jgi:outer membrane protein assembly factor BamB